MASFVPFDRTQAFLLPPDLKDWLPEDDLAHFIVAAVERVPLAAFKVNDRAGGKPQYHLHLMLALLIYSHANGIFSSSGPPIATSACASSRPTPIPITTRLRCSGKPTRRRSRRPSCKCLEV